MEDTIKLKQFVKDNNITMKSEWAPRNPNMDDSERKMDNWRCTLRTPDHRMTVYFSKGFGHNGAEPTVNEVLDCLASDSAGVENADFEAWCGDYGYDTDSRKAKRTYDICERQAKKLRAFLDDDAYETLLWKVERE